MLDGGILSRCCNLGSSVFGSESLLTTIFSLDRGKLWLRNPRETAFLGQIQAPAYCFSAESGAHSALSVPASPLLGSGRFELKQGRMFLLNTSQEQARKGTCTHLTSELTFFWSALFPLQ